MSQLDFSPHATVEFVKELSAVRVKWRRLHMSLERFQEICQEVLKLLIQNDSGIWIADQYESQGVFRQEVQEFINGALVETAKAEGVTKVLTIMPKESGLASMAAKKWNSEMIAGGQFVMVNFNTYDECEKWLKESLHAKS